MSKTNRARLLSRFALDVLAVLEHADDWGADTLQDIALLAETSGLAGIDEDGFFRRVHVDDVARGFSAWAEGGES